MPKETYTVPPTSVTDAKDVKYRVGRLKQPLEGADAKKGHVVFPRPGLTLKRHHGQHDPDRNTRGGLSMA